MKHVKIETGIRVVTDNACPQGKSPIPRQTWDEMVKAIDERANYIGPVLDHLLHLAQDVRPWQR